jgi:hypothetical protein
MQVMDCTDKNTDVPARRGRNVSRESPKISKNWFDREGCKGREDGGCAASLR